MRGVSVKVVVKDDTAILLAQNRGDEIVLTQHPHLVACLDYIRAHPDSISGNFDGWTITPMVEECEPEKVASA